MFSIGSLKSPYHNKKNLIKSIGTFMILKFTLMFWLLIFDYDNLYILSRVASNKGWTTRKAITRIKAKKKGLISLHPIPISLQFIHLQTRIKSLKMSRWRQEMATRRLNKTMKSLVWQNSLDLWVVQSKGPQVLVCTTSTFL